MRLRHWACSAVSVAALGLVLKPRGLEGTAYGQNNQPDAVAELRRIRLQIDSLQRRLLAFAQQRAADQTDEASDDDRVRALELRVAGMEKVLARRGADASGDKLGNTIRAPFTVLDSDGRALFRVDLTPSGAARLVVGDTSQAHAVLAVRPKTVGGATLALYSSADTPSAYLIGSPTNSVVALVADGRHADLRVDKEFAKLNLYTGSRFPGVTLQAGTAGYMTIAGPSGAVLIEASVSPENVGWVKTSGPGGGGLSSAPGMPSSFIRGWKR